MSVANIANLPFLGEIGSLKGLFNMPPCSLFLLHGGGFGGK